MSDTTRRQAMGATLGAMISLAAAPLLMGAAAAAGETHMTINRGFGLTGDPEGERAALFILSGSL